MPEFDSYEEESGFWDSLDTANFMVDDEDGFRFDTPNKRAGRVALLPEIAEELMRSA